MRAILVDWLVEVQESFELNHETLYTAVKILDLYMANKVVNKEELQLVGATACLIACKIDERFVYIILYIRKDTEIHMDYWIYYIIILWLLGFWYLIVLCLKNVYILMGTIWILVCDLNS